VGRFYFHISRGAELIADEEGLDLPDSLRPSGRSDSVLVNFWPKRSRAVNQRCPTLS
jgi:hypothetical protein